MDVFVIRLFQTYALMCFLVSQYKLEIMPRLAAELAKYMPEKTQISSANVVLAPMPGMLKSVSVKEGDSVSTCRQ